MTGWAIGEGVSTREGGTQSGRDGAALYDKLKRTVLPAFYNDWERFLDIMRHAMALNGSFFSQFWYFSISAIKPGRISRTLSFCLLTTVSAQAISW